jgi:predicted aldo/keto reductase-like oxidoreductase
MHVLSDQKGSKTVPDMIGKPVAGARLGGQFPFPGTSLAVQRMGYGAMQLAGPGVWGPPKDPDGAMAVLREAVAAGVNHIDTPTSTARTLPTRSSGKPCTRTLRNW